jgi:hypothetical protein
MTSKDTAKIALDEYEEFKMMNDFLSRIQVVNWLNTGIPPIFHDELMRLKEIVEAKGGALPLILQEMLNPEDLGKMNIGVDLVKDRRPSNQKVMMPDWNNYSIDSSNDWPVGSHVIPSYGWITHCYPKLWTLILQARIGLPNSWLTVITYWQQSEKFKELRGAIFSDSFIKTAAYIGNHVDNYKKPIEILEQNTTTIGNEQVMYYMGEDKRFGRIKFKGASISNNAIEWNYMGKTRQLERKDKDYTRWYGRFTDLPGVGKPKVEKWVDLGLTGFIDLMAIMDGNIDNYKNLMILPGVGSAESCRKMIMSQQFLSWVDREYKSPEYYMEEV